MSEEKEAGMVKRPEGGYLVEDLNKHIEWQKSIGIDEYVAERNRLRMIFWTENPGQPLPPELRQSADKNIKDL